MFLIPSFHGTTNISFSLCLVFPNLLRQSVFHSIDVVFPSVSIICNPFIYVIDVNSGLILSLRILLTWYMLLLTVVITSQLYKFC
jgi:hypothetical protein